MVRMLCCQRTKAYVARRTAEGKNVFEKINQRAGKVRRCCRVAGPPQAICRVMVLIAAQRMMASDTAGWQTTVPVSHEEVTLEREPITDANRGNAYDGPAISEEEHEVTLHAERPVVDTEAVPVERVRVGKRTVTKQETVGGDVRKEQIEVDDTEQRRR